jgi:hypothetical protein
MKCVYTGTGPCPAWWWGILLVLCLFAGCPHAATDTPENKQNIPGEEPEEQPGKEPGEEADPPAITKFIIAGVEGLIDEKADPKTITLTLPRAISREDLVPEEISLSEGASVSPLPDEAQDFTGPVEYTLTREELRTIYRVIVKTTAAITGFRIGAIEGIIAEEADPKTITLTLPAGTDLRSLSPVITLSDPALTVDPPSGEAQDFSRPVEYTLTLEGVTTGYRVSVGVAAPGASDARAITGFSINGVSGVIDGTAKTIALVLPFGTGLTALSPEITLSPGAVVQPASGVARNFADSALIAQKYTVTAENGMQAEYKVKVQTASRYSFTPVLTKEITLSPGQGSLSRSGSLSVSAAKDFDRYQWSVDGNTAGTGSRTITLNGRDYFIGAHYLGVTAWQQGIPFYAEMVFTVTP